MRSRRSERDGDEPARVGRQNSQHLRLCFARHRAIESSSPRYRLLLLLLLLESLRDDDRANIRAGRGRVEAADYLLAFRLESNETRPRPSSRPTISRAVETRLAGRGRTDALHTPPSLQSERDRLRRDGCPSYFPAHADLARASARVTHRQHVHLMTLAARTFRTAALVAHHTLQKRAAHQLRSTWQVFLPAAILGSVQGGEFCAGK
jgi:hypothetical protein